MVQEVPLPQQLPPDRLGSPEGGDTRPQAREGTRGGADRGRGRDRERDRGRGRGRGRDGDRTRSRAGSSERGGSGSSMGTGVGGGAGAEEAGDELTGYAGLSSTATPGRTKVLRGQPYIHDTCGGLTYRISPSSFFQTNTRQAEVLYGIVRQGAALRLGRTDTLLDLYCGTGAIGLSLAAECRQVVGVEVVGEWAAVCGTHWSVLNIWWYCDHAGTLGRHPGPRRCVRSCKIGLALLVSFLSLNFASAPRHLLPIHT